MSDPLELLYIATVRWHEKWARRERWHYWCNDPNEPPMFAEEFGVGGVVLIDEDAVHDELREAERDLAKFAIFKREAWPEYFTKESV